MPDNTSTAITTRDENTPLGKLTTQLQSRAREFAMVLPAHISADKFQRTVLTAVAQNPDLLTADRPSFILSCYKAAQDALLLDGREATLVTFNTRFKDPEDGQWKTKKVVQYMPMVYGLRKKILQSGEVAALEVGVVYKIEAENGYFRYEVGTEPPLNHAPMLDIPDEEATDEKIIAAYSIATMKDGTKSYEVMRRSEINKVRQMSQTGATGKTDRQGKAIPPKGPWVDWFAEMAKKTVMRRHAKTLPMSGDVLIDVEGRELESHMSTALALGSTRADAPELLTDKSGAQYDGETGEVIDDKTQVSGDDTSEERVTETAKSEPDAAQADESLFSTEDGENRKNAEVEAERILDEMSKAKNLVKLKAVYDGEQLEIAGLSASGQTDLVEAVENGYERNLKRLGTTRAKVASVIAEQAAAAKETASAK